MDRLRLFKRFRAANSGVVAVEFAFVAPLLMAMFFGGYSIVQAVAVGRKVTITTRALADLTSQFATMKSTDMTTVLNASTQIIAPFDPTVLSMRLTEVTTDITGLLPTVTWSVARNMTAYSCGAPFTLPLSMLKPNTSYIFSEVGYQYNPLVTTYLAPFSIKDHIYMLPRISNSVAYSC